MSEHAAQQELPELQFPVWPSQTIAAHVIVPLG